MFMSPTCPFVDGVNSGGGAITSDFIAACTTRSGANFTSGGGATTCISGATMPFNGARVASSGTAGTTAPVAIMFGMATSFLSLRSGGTTMVWDRLSASGGTDRIGCLA